MTVPAATGVRAERTRGSLLAAAEATFAERGFDGTRLEDVASRVGIKRASIVYHFRDKRALYEAVLASVFGDFLARVEPALACEAPPLERLERAVGCWVHYMSDRPAFARILLREVANASPGSIAFVQAQIEPFVALVESFLESMPPGQRERFDGADAAHVASAIVGASLFHSAALPCFLPGHGGGEHDRGSRDRHREEVLRITRQLLGAAEPETSS